MRRGSLALFAASLVACFSPTVDTDTDAETSNDGSSGSSGSPTTNGSPTSSTTTNTGPTTDPDTTVGPGETSDTDPSATGGDDQPPEFESFTVNGSTSPAEVDEGGTIELEASVTDDIGIASVEFFDGSESLGVVNAAPYELDLVVSSADSGSHTYRAVATDTGDQTAESEEVTLSINIVGGEVLFFREQLFTGSTGLGGPGLSVATTSSGRVLVTGMVSGSVAGRVIAFNDDLSTLWTLELDRATRARPVDLGTRIVVASWVSGTWTYGLHELDDSSSVDSIAFGVPAGDPVVGLLGSRAVGGEDGVVVTTGPNELARYSPMFSGPAWTSTFPADAIITDLDAFADGALLVHFNTDTPCAGSSNHCIRRIEADGATGWTSETAADAVATRPSGGVVGLARRQSGGLSWFEFDSNGQASAPEVVIDEDRAYDEVADVADDGTAGFALTGTFVDGSNDTAIVARYNADGDLIWEQTEVAEASTSMGLSVAVLDEAIYVAGIEDPSVEGLSVLGEAFVAKLRR
jgi:hypothetical protein